MKRTIMLLSLGLTGCASDFTSGGRINTARLQSTDAVPFAEIVQNIRCDVQAFLLEAKDVPEFSMGGIIAATVTASNVQSIGGGGSVPVAPSFEIGLRASKSNAQTFGFLNRQAIVVYRDAKAEPQPENLINCAAYGKDGESTSTAGTKLTGPLLNLRELRRQMNQIPKGSPHLRLPGFRITGSILLVKSSDVGGGIKVFFISADAASTSSASYKIDFDLATNWKPLLADYEIEVPKAPEPAAPNVLYLIQTQQPPKPPKRKTSPRPTPKPGEIDYDPGIYRGENMKAEIKFPGIAFESLTMTPEQMAKATEAAAQKARRADPSAPRPDTPK